MANSISTTSLMTPVLTPTGSDTTRPAINQQTTPAVDQINTVHSAPQMKDFNITKEKRQQLRGILINSQTLAPDEAARQLRSKGIFLSDDERKTYYAALDEVVRWNTFLVQTGVNLPEVVDFVSHAYNVNEEEHQRALVMAVESHESFKNIIRTNITLDAICLTDDELNLCQLDNVALTQKISDSFSPDRFFAAFGFMEDYLDLKSSTPLGKW
jgi:hypothetical protein